MTKCRVLIQIFLLESVAYILDQHFGLSVTLLLGLIGFQVLSEGRLVVVLDIIISWFQVLIM